MRKILVLILLCFFNFIEYTQIYGDVVYLKSGGYLEGEVVEESNNTVNLKIKIGQVTLQRGEIDSIDKKELPPDFFKDVTHVKTIQSPQPPIKKEVVQPTDVELKAEGYKEVTLPKFNLNIDTEFKRLYDGDAIIVNGATNLPPKAVLYLIFKTHSQTIAVCKMFVENTSFETKIGPFSNKRIPPGSYIVEAVFSPERQESEKIKDTLVDAKEIIATSNITIGSPNEAEEKTNNRKLELTSQLGELERLYDELNREYAAQKRDFNEPVWNTWSAKWQFQLRAIKSSNEDYHNKTLVLDFPVQENVLNELVYEFELLWNRYTAELFKMNNLTFDAPPTNDTRDSELLNKTIQENLKASNDFLMALK